MKTALFALSILAITLMATVPSFAQAPASTDTSIVVFAGTAYADTIVVAKTDLEAHTTLALASGMPEAFSSLRKRVEKVEKSGTGTGTGAYNGNGAYTIRALGVAANRFGEAIVLQQAGDDSSSIAFQAFQAAKGTPKVRKAVAEQFVGALVAGAMNGHAVASGSGKTDLTEADVRKIAREEARPIARKAAVAAYLAATGKDLRGKSVSNGKKNGLADLNALPH